MEPSWFKPEHKLFLTVSDKYDTKKYFHEACMQLCEMPAEQQPLLNVHELTCYRNCWTKGTNAKLTVEDNIQNSAAKFYFDQFTKEFYAKHPEYGVNQKYLKPEYFTFPLY